MDLSIVFPVDTDLSLRGGGQHLHRLVPLGLHHVLQLHQNLRPTTHKQILFAKDIFIYTQITSIFLVSMIQIDIQIKYV